MRFAVTVTAPRATHHGNAGTVHDDLDVAELVVGALEVDVQVVVEVVVGGGGTREPRRHSVVSVARVGDDSRELDDVTGSKILTAAGRERRETGEICSQNQQQ